MMLLVAAVPVALVFSIAGAVMLFVPAKTLLRFDRKTGHSLYVGAPDQETGLRRAQRFYRWFGLAFLVLPWLVLGGAYWFVL